MNDNTITTETVNCDLCRSEHYDQVLVGRDLLHDTPGRWTIVRCRNCSLHFTCPRPSQETIDKVYPRDYPPHHSRTHKKRDTQFKLQRWALSQQWNYPPDKQSSIGKLLSLPIMLWLKAKSRNFDLFPWNGHGKLLDYGCGAGGYLARMQRLGWQVTGMDMSPEAVDTCRKRGLEAPYVGTAPDLQFPPETFDMVTLWHVLEHVPSPTQTLKQINTILKPDGKVIIVVPNIESSLAQRFGKFWFPLELPRHLTHFNKKPLARLIEKNKFTVEKISWQHHGNILRRSLSFLAMENGNNLYKYLFRRKKLCRWIEKWFSRTGHLDIIMIHARKINPVTKE